MFVLVASAAADPCLHAPQYSTPANQGDRAGRPTKQGCCQQSSKTHAVLPLMTSLHSLTLVFCLLKAHLCVSALGGIARLMTSIGGEEGHVQMAGLAQLQITLLAQQVSSANQLVQATHAQACQSHAHLLGHKGKEVHLQHDSRNTMYSSGISRSTAAFVAAQQSFDRESVVYTSKVNLTRPDTATLSVKHSSCSRPVWNIAAHRMYAVKPEQHDICRAQYCVVNSARTLLQDMGTAATPETGPCSSNRLLQYSPVSLTNNTEHIK